MTRTKVIFNSSMLILTVVILDLLSGAEVDIFIPSFPELQKIFNISVFWQKGYYPQTC